MVKKPSLKKAAVLGLVKKIKALKKSKLQKPTYTKIVTRDYIKKPVYKQVSIAEILDQSQVKGAPVSVRVVSEDEVKKEIHNRLGFDSLKQSTKQPNKKFNSIFSRVVYNLALVMAPVLILVPMFYAFEAHIINTTAALAQIDPPVLSLPGDIGWNNPDGGVHTEPIDIIMSNNDTDATHIFYTYALSSDPDILSDPFCGGPFGGLKTESQHLIISGTTVIKAIACDGNSVGSHFSLVNTKIYQFPQDDELCELVPINLPSGTALMAGAYEASFGDIFVSANVTINGNVRGNHDLQANGIGSNRYINGDVTVSGSIENSNFTISGSSNIGAVPAELPEIDSAFWKDKANDGGVVLGSLVIPDNSGIIDLGPSEIMGNLEIGNNNTVNITGTLYVHGNLVINNSVDINQHASFANSLSIIIVDGTIDIRTGVVFNGASSHGAFLLVSNTGPQSGDDAAIETESDDSDMGDVVLFAQNGDVHINQNRTVLAIYARKGTALASPSIDLDSNVTINYRPVPTEAGCGPTFSPLNELLINEFLPNPYNSNTGTKGGNLDGEFIEIYNGSSSPISLEGYILYDDLLPTPQASSTLWTSDLDFANGTSTLNVSVVSNSLVLNSGVGTGTFETLLDVGEGNRADWQNVVWTETNTATGNVCISASVSNDGVNFTPLSSCDDITAMDLNAAGLPDSRFLKLQITLSRANSLDSVRLDNITAAYNLYDYNELFITSNNTDTGTTTIPSGGLLVVYRDGDSDFELDNDGTDTVRLYNGHLWQGAVLVDERAYDYKGSVPENKSFTRMPDGTNNWIDPDPSPGESNDEFVYPSTYPSLAIIFESEPTEEEVVEGSVLGTETVSTEENTEDVNKTEAKEDPKDNGGSTPEDQAAGSQTQATQAPTQTKEQSVQQPDPTPTGVEPEPTITPTPTPIATPIPDPTPTPTPVATSTEPQDVLMIQPQSSTTSN